MAGAGGSGQEAARPRADMFGPSPLVAALGLFVLPLIWWAPLGIVAPIAAIGLGLLLLRYWLAPRVLAPGPVRAISVRATLWLMLAGALLAAGSFVLDAGASLRIAIAAFVVTRSLLLFPAARSSLIWLAGAHVAASLLSGIAVGAAAAPSVVLISVAALLCDLARLSRVSASQSGGVATEVQESSAPSREANDASADKDRPHAEAATVDAAPGTETAGAAIPKTEGSQPASVSQERNEALDIVRSAAALAATFVAGLLLIVQTPSAPLATRSVAPQSDAPSQAEIDAEWRARFPWAFPELPRSETVETLPAECTRADHYERIELHALLEPPHEDAGGWTSVAAQFERPPVELAPAEAADTVFGEPCSNDARTRVIDGARVGVADGLEFSVGETPIVVGAVYQLTTEHGPVLLARAWSNESGIVLLLSDVSEEARIIAISNRSAFDRGGRLFTVEGAGGQLWYGALSEDAHSASAVDIIDVSGDAPHNTGNIVAWGASTCGQTLGDPLYPAEENCVENPAWAYWLVDARYSSEAHDRVDVIWNVRRQIGHPGEPATYEEPFDELMHGAYERRADGWRLMRLAGPELNGLQAQLTPFESEGVVQQ